MVQRTTWSAGQVLAQAEGSIGSSMRRAVADYYQGYDFDAGQAIRSAETATEAAQIVTAIRQGRVAEVAMVAVSAALGVVGGALAQKAVNNAAIKGVPIVTPLGALPVIAGAALPISLSGRSMLAAGGLSYIAGATLYRLLTAPPAPEGLP